MAEGAGHRRVVAAAAAMILAAQLLAIATDVILRQNDPSDVVLLVVLVALSILMLRRVRWARWVMVVLVAAGGLLELLGVPLLIVTRVAPGLWSKVDQAAPALQSLHSMVVVFATGHAFPLLVGSIALEAVLDLCAVGMLVLAPSVRSYFSVDPMRQSA